MLRKIAKASIRGYQKFISPHKGFRCAHHALHAKGSCSQRALSIIEKKRVWQWLPEIRAELISCSDAFEQLVSKGICDQKGKPRRKDNNKDSGKCDSLGEVGECAIDGCDIGECNGVGSCDIGSC